MREHDALDPEVLQQLHDRLLVAHLRYSAESVPWYRERIDARSISSPDDLSLFPVLDKETVRAAGDRLRSEAWTGKLISLETGGSSGEPLRFWSDQDRESSQLACKVRARAWWGLNPGHRQTDLWGSPIETTRDAGLRSIVAGLLGFQLLPAFRLNDRTMSSFRGRLARGRADFIYGYASAIGRYARFLEERDEDLLDLRLKVAVCTAETLLPRDRELITRRIAPVANEYGCRDGGLIAHEDPSGHLRVMHDAVHVEILGDDGQTAAPGADGEVVVTNLHARGYPMIRYRLGDRASLAEGPPPDGLPHPALRQVSGRTTDFLVAMDGSRVHALGVIYVVREIEGVARFRVVQDTREAVEVLVVPGAGLDTDGVSNRIAAGVHSLLGEGMRVAVRFVEELEPLPSGKHRYVICGVEESG